MHKVVKKFNDIYEKYKHQQNFESFVLVKIAFSLDKREEKY